MINFIPSYEFGEGRSYMSLPNEVKMIPNELTERAKNAIAEMSAIKKEFAIHQERWDRMKESREESFDEAFTHYDATKKDYKRLALPNGQVIWVEMNNLVGAIGNEPFDGGTILVHGENLLKDEQIKTWPLGDTSEFF